MSLRVIALLFFLSFGLSACYQAKISSANFENPSVQDKSQGILTRNVSISTAIPFEIDISEPRNARTIGALVALDIMEHAQISNIEIGKLKDFFVLKNSQTDKVVRKDDVAKLRTTLGAFKTDNNMLTGTINVTVEDFLISAKSKVEKTEQKTKDHSKEIGLVKFKLINNGLSEHTINALMNAKLIENQFAKEIKKDKDGNYDIVIGPMKLWFESSITQNKKN